MANLRNFERKVFVNIWFGGGGVEYFGQYYTLARN